MPNEQQTKTTGVNARSFNIHEAKSGLPVLVKWDSINKFVRAESFIWGTKDYHAVLIEGGMVCCFDSEGRSRNPSYVNGFSLFMEDL